MKKWRSKRKKGRSKRKKGRSKMKLGKGKGKQEEGEDEGEMYWRKNLERIERTDGRKDRVRQRGVGRKGRKKGRGWTVVQN